MNVTGVYLRVGGYMVTINAVEVDIMQVLLRVG